MIINPGSSAELRAKVRLSRNAIAHLWNGGILSLTVEWPRMEADFELSYSVAVEQRGTRILIKRVSVP